MPLIYLADDYRKLSYECLVVIFFSFFFFILYIFFFICFYKREVSSKVKHLQFSIQTFLCETSNLNEILELNFCKFVEISMFEFVNFT